MIGYRYIRSAPLQEAVELKDPSPAEEKRYTILVIDDRWENRAVLQNLLEPLGFNVLEAENGQTGLEKLLTNCPDLVIMDLIMPVMDGFEFLQKVRTIEASPTDQGDCFLCIGFSAGSANGDGLRR